MARVLRLPYDEFRQVRIEVSRAPNPRKQVLPIIPVGDVLKYPVDVRLVDLEQIEGNTDLRDQIILIALAKQRGVKAVFEFGTFDGKTTANLATNLPDAEILTIDLPFAAAPVMSASKADLRLVHRWSPTRLDALNVTRLCGDTARFDFSPWYGTRDFIFVDACHEYEYVKNDTEVALKLLKPGGLIVWHDYGQWPGVTRALNEFHAVDPRFRGLRNIQDTILAVLL